MAEQFAMIARELLRQGTVAATLSRISALVTETVDGCEHAGLTVVRGRLPRTEAATDEVPERVDAIQYETDEGPCLDAIRQHEVFRVEDLRTERRWPRFSARAAAETGVRSMMSFRVFAEQDTLGALNLYSSHPDAFDAEGAAVGSIYAAHAAVAVRGAEATARVDQLEEALGTRTIIGQATGIIMAHRGLTAEGAFAELRRASQRLNVKLRDIAERVTRTGENPEDL